MQPEKLNFLAFAQRYHRQQAQPAAIEDLRATLQAQKDRFQPEGWVLLECQQMNSSHLGELAILPYGPNNTYKTPPTHPVSPRGLASDMSIVVAILPVEEFDVH